MGILLNDNVVLITGGSGLLGVEFANAILENGGVPVIADISENEDTNKNIHYVHLDITSKTSVLYAFEEVKRKFGQVDALVNNAYPRNKNYGRDFLDVEYDDFCENISMNLGGYFLTSQIAAKYFEEKKYGNIINIASIYGVIAPNFDVYTDTNMTMPVEYSVIKSGVIHLTKYLAKYFSGKNIRVNALSPGGIKNGQDVKFIKRYNEYCFSKGMLDARDISGALLFLLSDASNFINGHNIVVDDGFII